MGANDREFDVKENKRAKRREQRSRRAANAPVDWSAFDWLAAVALTKALVTCGGCLRIGTTRDGGAWALGVYKGDDYATEYIRPNEDFTASLLEIAGAWEIADQYVIELEHLTQDAKRKGS